MITLSKDILNQDWYRDKNVRLTYIHLLLSCEMTPVEIDGETVNRGELISTYEQLSKQIGISVKELRNALRGIQRANKGQTKGQTTHSTFIVFEHIVGQTKGQTKGKRRANENEVIIEPVINKDSVELNNDATATEIPPKKSRKKKEVLPLNESELAFLEQFNRIKKSIRPDFTRSHKALSPKDRENLTILLNYGYGQEEFEHSITAFICSDWWRKNGNDIPHYILRQEHFEKHLNVESINQVKNDNTPKPKTTREDKWASGFDNLKDYANSRENEPSSEQGNEPNEQFTTSDATIVEYTNDTGGATTFEPPTDSDIWRELQS